MTRILCRLFGIQFRPLAHLDAEPGCILSDEQIEALPEVNHYRRGR